MNFEDELKTAQATAEKLIRRYLPDEKTTPGRLAEAMNYSVLAGGKRVRPVLMLKTYEMYGGDDEGLIGPFAAAIEMIHTSSLVHDDLPEIDGDLYRRGRKTTHAVYGPALGVLAGDALMNYAYETAVMACCRDIPEDEAAGTSEKTADASGAMRTDAETAAAPGDHAEEDSTRNGRVMRSLSVLLTRTGIRGMLGGQSVDVENEKNGTLQFPKETLDYIYLHKTAALIEAPLMIGAILGGAPEKDTEVLEQVGRKAGLAFQIRDDVLDVTKTTEEIGKPAGSDEKNGKTTYVTLLGVSGADREAQRLTDEAAALLDGLSPDVRFLREYLDRLARRSR